MASSRKPAPRPEAADAADAALLAALAAAVDSFSRQGPLAVAFSGGRDSTALLELACRLRALHAPRFAQLVAFHVDHRLVAESGDWARHCEAHCAARGVPLRVLRVDVVARGRGVEDAARRARYAALAVAAKEAGAPIVLTAHHRDDRIETFLLQWLRGAGPDGLAGPAMARPLEPSQPAGPWLLRPLLDVDGAAIEAYCARHRLRWITDPTNASTAFARNALRHDVLPALARIRPGFRGSTARSIELVAELAATVREVATDDLALCIDGTGALRLQPWLALGPARRANVLRAWLAGQRIEAPSRARLRDALAALAAGREADLGALWLRIADGVVQPGASDATTRLAAASPRLATPDPARLRWHGEHELLLPLWRGRLRFLPTAEAGFDAGWLRSGDLEVRARRGGERFKPHPARPSKTLKQVYQEAGLDVPERRRLPLVWRGADLLYVAGIGADARCVGTGGDRIRLEWIADGDAAAALI